MSLKIDSILRKSFLSLIGIWLLIGLISIGYKILGNDLTLAAMDHSGDGMGGIADIGFLKSNPFLVNEGINVIPSFMLPPTSRVDNWWIVKQFLSLFLTPSNVYDVMAIIFWPLNFLAGYFLFKTLKLSTFASIIFGLAIAGLEVFNTRITAHLTMAAIFVPVLQIAYAFKIIEAPSLKNTAIFSFLCFLCFLSNEYYGYFGFLFSVLLILVYYLMNVQRIKEFTIKGVIIGAFIFISGMIFVYKEIFLALFANQDGEKGLFVHSYFDHTFYSVKNPLELFQSSLYDISFHSTFLNPGEFTFHIGFFVVIFIAAFFVFAINRKISLDTTLLLTILFAGIILALFGLSPDYFMSLEKLTYKLAPQFRVGARAYLWVSIAVLTFASVLYRDVTKVLSTAPSSRLSFLLPLSSLSLVFLLIDSTMGFYFTGPKLYPVPENTAYKAISAREEGLLLELPFYGTLDPPHFTYRYMYNFIDHEKPFVNYPVFQMNLYDPEFALAINQFKFYVNNPTEDVIDTLRLSGIKFIAVNDPVIKAKFDEMGYQSTVFEGGTSIYELDSENQFDLKTVILCNVMNYDLSLYQQLPTQTGSWTQSGISSSGTDGALLFGPNSPLNAGDYVFRMEGVLSSGTVRIDIVSDEGTTIYLNHTLNKSMVERNGSFTLQESIHLDRNVGDLHVRVWVNKDSVVEIQDYLLSDASINSKCQDKIFEDNYP